MIGLMTIQGANNVWVNNKKLDGGKPVEVHSKDYIRIGEQSSAYLFYLGGGFIQFDENTDPVIELVWQQTQCLLRLLRFTYGQAYSDTNPQCDFDVETKFGKWIKRGSSFNLQTDDENSVMTVVKGGMALTDPSHVEMSAGQRLAVSAREVGPLLDLTVAELNQLIQWRDKYPQPPQPSMSSTNWGAVAAGVAAISVGVGIGLLSSHGGGRKPPSGGGYPPSGTTYNPPSGGSPPSTGETTPASTTRLSPQGLNRRFSLPSSTGSSNVR